MVADLIVECWEWHMMREICRDFQEEGRKVDKREVSVSLTSSLRLGSIFPSHLPLTSRLAPLASSVVTVQLAM